MKKKILIVGPGCLLDEGVVSLLMHKPEFLVATMTYTESKTSIIRKIDYLRSGDVILCEVGPLDQAAGPKALAMRCNPAGPLPRVTNVRYAATSFGLAPRVLVRATFWRNLAASSMLLQSATMC